LSQVVYVSRARDAIEHDLDAFVDRLGACLRTGADLSAAIGVGQDMVRAGFTKARSVQATIDVLGPGLSDMEGVELERVVPVLGALAAGFVAASRDRLFSEQEDMRQTLVRAKENVERDLQASEARFQDVFATSALGMVISDLGGGVARANAALERMLGYRKGTLFRKRLDDLFHPDEVEFLRRRYGELADGENDTVQERTRFQRADGDTAWVRVSVTLLRDGHGTPDHHVTMVEDISDLHLLEHQFSHQVTHDMLTGLVNRQAFEGRLEESLGNGGVTLFHIGLDNLGTVNNGLGRHAGDRLLTVAAQRLGAVVGGHDAVVARVAGDEFAILVRQRDNGPDIAAVAAEINETLAEPTYVDGHGIAATATVAVLRSPAADTDPADLLRATDITLHRLKSHGRRQWGLVDPDLDAACREQYRLAASIPGAWEDGELDVDYRPVVTLADRTVVAVEALLRWDSPVHGYLDHDRCREILRDTGLGGPVDQWALVVAAERLVELGEKLGEMPRLYVELTAEQSADQDLIGAVRRASAGGFVPDRFDLGIPVDALADTQTEDNLAVLTDLGIHVVLTDFGQSGGDIAGVEDYPVRAVRLARAVVARIGVEPNPKSVFVRAMRDLVSLVRECGTSVVVPGINVAAQAQWWLEAGADQASGSYFGEPDIIETLLT
jgi:PAS domain S-box-containing protein/diguanylate cyclase (GGDEF)-like protein